MQDPEGDVVDLSYVALSSLVVAAESCDQVVETSFQARETLDAIARTILLEHVVKGNPRSFRLIASKSGGNPFTG
jgi:hypothetical protein